jgi:hypothetical protein
VRAHRATHFPHTFRRSIACVSSHPAWEQLRPGLRLLLLHVLPGAGSPPGCAAVSTQRPLAGEAPVQEGDFVNEVVHTLRECIEDEAASVSDALLAVIKPALWQCPRPSSLVPRRAFITVSTRTGGVLPGGVRTPSEERAASPGAALGCANGSTSAGGGTAGLICASSAVSLRATLPTGCSRSSSKRFRTRNAVSIVSAATRKQSPNRVGGGTPGAQAGAIRGAHAKQATACDVTPATCRPRAGFSVLCPLLRSLPSSSSSPRAAPQAA